MKNQLDAITDLSDSAIVQAGLDRTINTWNRGAEQIFGYRPEEIIGHSLDELLVPEGEREAVEIMRRVCAGERIDEFETVRLARDGRTIDVTLSLAPVKDNDGVILGLVFMARDITARKQAEMAAHEQELHARNRTVVLETASRVALDILSSRTGVEALKHIADAARVLAGARYAALGVANPNGDGLQEFITVGLTPAEEAAIGPRPHGVGLLGLLLHRTEPLRVDRLSAHPASSGFPPNHPPMDSFLGVPIRRGAQVLGSLYLTNKEDGDSFTEADEMSVQALGAHAAVAIHNMQMMARQRALVSQLLTAQEEERRSVAYDLHDGLTQYVMASHAHFESFRRAHSTGQEEKAQRELELGLKYLQESVLESRRLVNGLRLLSLDDLGLAGALDQLVNEEKSRAGWEQAELVQNLDDRRFDRTLETVVYRVAQEALTNARKHAATERVQVLLEFDPDPVPAPLLRLEVRDWGIGFDPETTAGMSGHFGLHGMVERVSLLDGSYTLRSSPGNGTVIETVFPALEPNPADEI